MIITDEVKKALHSQNISVATLQEAQRQRSITYSCTISGDFKLTVVCIKFADRSFINITERPEIYRLENNLWIALYHYLMDEEIINYYVYKEVIIPATCKVRETLMNHKTPDYTGINTNSTNHVSDEIGENDMISFDGEIDEIGDFNSHLFDEIEDIGMDSFNTTIEDTSEVDTSICLVSDEFADIGSDSFNTTIEEDDTLITQVSENVNNINSTPTNTSIEINSQEALTNSYSEYRYIAILQDGAIPQINAIKNHLEPYCKEKNKDIIWGKYAAGTSLTQSPNDKGAMHVSLHRLLRSNDFNYRDIPESTKLDWEIVKKKLSGIGATFPTVWKCLKHSSSFLSKAFNEYAIYGGLRDAGIIGLDGKYSPVTVLNQCPHWKKIPTDDGNWLINSSPRLCQRFDQNGYLDEEFLENFLEERPGVDNSLDRQGTELNLLGVSRQRCLIIGNNNLEEYKQQKAATNSRSSTEKERTRSFSCVHCHKKIPPADNNWRKCKHNKCSSKYCTNPLCITILTSHEELCKHKPKRTRAILRDTQE